MIWTPLNKFFGHFKVQQLVGFDTHLGLFSTPNGYQNQKIASQVHFKA